MTRTGKRRAVLGVIAATSLVVAAVVGYDIARRASSPPTETVGPVSSGSGSPAAPSNSLTLSILDQPRPVPEIRFQDEQGHDLTLIDFRAE